MALDIDYFDKQQLLKIIGRKLKSIAQNKGIKIEDWANNGTGLGQGDLSNVLNGRRGVSSEKLLVIAHAIGVSEKELKEIVAESKKDELRIFYGENLDIIPNLDIELYKDFDLETIELLKDLDFDADFLRNIALSTKGTNKDRLKEDLKKIFEHYKRIGELDNK